MKKNDKAQLKNMAQAELEKRIRETRDKLWALERDTDLGKQKNVKEAKGLRKDVARMLTVISEQNLKPKS